MTATLGSRGSVNESAARSAMSDMRQQALYTLRAIREEDDAKATKHRLQFESALERYTRITGYTMTLAAAAAL